MYPELPISDRAVVVKNRPPAVGISLSLWLTVLLSLLCVDLVPPAHAKPYRVAAPDTRAAKAIQSPQTDTSDSY